jgi:hypothetical protein
MIKVTESRCHGEGDQGVVTAGRLLVGTVWAPKKDRDSRSRFKCALSAGECRDLGTREKLRETWKQAWTVSGSLDEGASGHAEADHGGRWMLCLKMSALDFATASRRRRGQLDM